MPEQERRGWIIVGVLFLTLFVIWGPFNAFGVFFLPIIKTFGWSRARFAMLGAFAALAFALSGPLIGWLIDRSGARKLMIIGAAAMAVCYVALALANSFVQFLVIFIIMGVANAASTVIPCSLVITNWFGERRGLALGIAFAAIPLGGTCMTIFESHIVSRYGWRVGFVTQAVPIAVIALPLLIGLLRTRPSGETPLVHVPGTAQILLSGLEVRETLRTRSFWLIAIAQFLATAAAFGIGAHFIPYLIGIGYSPILAAEILSGAFVISALGNFVAGPLADRLTGRVVLALAYVACAVGLFSLLAAAHVGALAVYITTFALVAGVPPVVLPLVIAESMGLKRLGSVLGLEGIFAAVGAAVGPIVAGRIFDVSGTYASAIWIFVMMTMVSAIAIYSCRPLEDEQTRIAISTKAAASV